MFIDLDFPVCTVQERTWPKPSHHVINNRARQRSKVTEDQQEPALDLEVFFRIVD